MAVNSTTRRFVGFMNIDKMIKDAKEKLEKAESKEDVDKIAQDLSKVTDPIMTKFYQANPDELKKAAEQAGINPDDMSNPGAGPQDGGSNPDEGWN